MKKQTNKILIAGLLVAFAAHLYIGGSVIFFCSIYFKKQTKKINEAL